MRVITDCYRRSKWDSPVGQSPLCVARKQASLVHSSGWARLRLCFFLRMLVDGDPLGAQRKEDVGRSLPLDVAGSEGVFARDRVSCYW